MGWMVVMEVVVIEKMVEKVGIIEVVEVAVK